MNSDNRRNNRSAYSCWSRTRDCVVYTCILSFSTLLFVIGMVLTVYLTHIDHSDETIAVLIVDSCLLYLLGFASSIYSIYYSKPDVIQSANDINSLQLSQLSDSSAERSSSSRRRRPSEVVVPLRTKEQPQKTPPPPYDAQMSEISRLLLPRTSERTESSTRELEITEEARKLIRRMYEELTRSEQRELPQPSADKQSPQQMVQRPKTPLRRQETLSSTLSQQNLIVQKQKTVGKSPVVRQPSTEFRTSQQNRSPFPTHLDLERLILGNEGISAVSPESSPRIAGHPSVSFHKDQQKVARSSFLTQSDQSRLIPGNEGINAVSLESSHRILGNEGINAVSPESSPRILGRPSASFRTDQVVQQNKVQSSIATQWDQERSIVGNEGISAVSPEISSRIPGRPSSSFRLDHVLQQKVAPSKLPTQSEQGRLSMGTEGVSTVSLESSPRMLRHPSVSFHKDEAIQQKVAPSTHSSELDFERLVTGREAYYAVSPLLSIRNPDRPLVDLSTNENIEQKSTLNKPPNNLGLEKFFISDDGCLASTPQLSPSKGAVLKVAHKRKLTSSSHKLRTKPKMKGKVPQDMENSQNIGCEEIELVGTVQSTASNEALFNLIDYPCVESEINNLSEQTSVKQAVSEPGLKERKRTRTSSIKVRRQLSAPSTRIFYQLGQSPETVLDALGQCFDLTPDEWMVAWEMSKKGVPPNERAKILGVHLHEDPYNGES